MEEIRIRDRHGLPDAVFPGRLIGRAGVPSRGPKWTEIEVYAHDDGGFVAVTRTHSEAGARATVERAATMDEVVAILGSRPLARRAIGQARREVRR